MDKHRVGAGTIADVRALSGGTQNQLLSLGRGGHRFVLRMPPEVKRPNSDDTMRREARILAALGGTAVPHPRLVAAELDTALTGSAFYLMEEIDGFSAPSGWPPGFTDAPERVRRVGLAAAEALAELAAVDYAAVGLADLGRPGSFVERQVSRWQWQLDSYEPAHALPATAVSTLAGWLQENCPTTESKGIVHGDFHLGNLVLAPETGDVTAIVDWELATIGDPLLDLAQFLVCWPGTEGNDAFGNIMPVSPLAGLATESEIVDRYAEKTGRSVDALPWFKVLAAFRLAVLLEGTSVRAERGEASAELGRQFHRTSMGLIRQAQREVAACSI
ncbi:phosphotransferase family protein [Nocardia cyriacigeorgica]|nr:phosphotransferase family protein [Nocardia cyriacigeorgica]NEW27078.1 phosphotransferase family protein [Nocardia cyriacigeorgica]